MMLAVVSGIPTSHAGGPPPFIVQRRQDSIELKWYYEFASLVRQSPFSVTHNPHDSMVEVIGAVITSRNVTDNCSAMGVEIDKALFSFYRVSNQMPIAAREHNLQKSRREIHLFILYYDGASRQNENFSVKGANVITSGLRMEEAADERHHR